MPGRVYPRSSLSSDERYRIARQHFLSLSSTHSVVLDSYLQTHASIKNGLPSQKLQDTCIDTPYHKLRYEQVEKAAANPGLKVVKGELGGKAVDSWLENGAVDAYMAMCGRYVSRVRENSLRGLRKRGVSSAAGDGDAGGRQVTRAEDEGRDMEMRDVAPETEEDEEQERSRTALSAKDRNKLLGSFQPSKLDRNSDAALPKS